MKYPAHSKYKASRLKWLSVVPDHWELKRLRFLAEINPTFVKNPLDKSELVSFVPMEMLGEYGNLNLELEKCVYDVKNGYTFFSEGDVILAKITPCFENGKGAIARNLTNGIGFGTTELHVLKPDAALLPEFAFYLTISQSFRKMGEAEMYGAGGQKRVPTSFIKDFPVPLPPLPEQKAIARFLDHKTARIDELIAKKEKLLRLLGEKRSALITRAVTKGLDSNVKMKDSGIEWLGEIPAHWEIFHLKREFELVNYGISEPLQESGEYGVLRMGDLRNGEINTEKLGYVDHISEDLVLEEGDIVYNRTNSLALVGKAAIFRGNKRDKISIASYLVRLRLKRSTNSEYQNYLLNTLEILERARSLALPAIGQANLNPTRYGYIEICHPPYDEQLEITRHLRNKTEIIDSLRKKIEDAIDKLKEYRTALITAAVTGKIDVRNFKPEQVEEELA